MVTFFFRSLFPVITVMAIFNPAEGMEEFLSKEDPLHDNHLQHVLGQHGFCPEHFSCQKNELHDPNAEKIGSLEEVLIFDVNKHLERLKAIEEVHMKCVHKMHEAHMERVETPAPTLPDFSLPITPSSSFSYNPLKWVGKGMYTLATTITYPVTYFFSKKVIVKQEKEEGKINELSSSLPEDIHNETLKGVKPSKTYLALSIDGGGVRGLIPATFAEYLEGKIGTNRNISQVFDYVAGTSIGGIISLGLTMPAPGGEKTPCMSGGDLVKLFKEDASTIFPQTNSWNLPVKIWNSAYSLFRPQYDSKPLEKILQKNLKDNSLQNALTNVMVTTIYAPKNELYLFSNFKSPECLAWKAGRRTSAAPTYFASDENYIDGGLTCNDPAFELLMQIKGNTGANLNQVTVLSWGTGEMPFTVIPSNAGVLNGVASIVETCMLTQQRSVNLTLKQLLKEDQTYFRINPKLETHIPLDKLSIQNMEVLTKAAQLQFDLLDKFLESDVMRNRLEELD